MGQIAPVLPYSKSELAPPFFLKGRKDTAKITYFSTSFLKRYQTLDCLRFGRNETGGTHKAWNKSVQWAL